MDTTTATPIQEKSSEVGFETRLAMASIAIDVALSRHGESPVVPAAPSPELKPAAQPEPQTPAQTLWEAAQLIRERGWAQGEYSRQDGALCALGAIREAAAGDAVLTGLATGMLMNRIERLHGRVYHAIWTWNDAPDRTWVQVTGLMERG